MLNYYTSPDKSSFDTVFASGVKDGVGSDCYRVISSHQDNIIWGASDKLPDISRLIHGEKYLWKDSNGKWWLVQLAADGKSRELKEITDDYTTYTMYSDGSKWVAGDDRVVRNTSDFYSQSEVDELIEAAKDVTRYVDFDELTPRQIEELRGYKGDVGEKGDSGPIGLQGPRGVPGISGSLENFVVLSEEEYQALSYIDPNKFYFTYESDEVIPKEDSTVYVDGTTLVIEGIVEDETLVLDHSSATYLDGAGGGTLSIVSQASSVFAPSFNPPSGTYEGEKTVVIKSTTPDAEIRYTLDGMEPTKASPLYVNPITLDQSCTIKAKAYKLGCIDSPVSESRYELVFEKTVSAPKITPNSGVFNENDPIIIDIQCSTPGAIIRYTLDGSDPNETSPIYVGPLEPQGSITIVRAKGFLSNYNASETTTNIYRLGLYNMVSLPIFNISSGIYTEPQRVKIRVDTPGAIIRYTTNGADPTSNSLIYSEPILIQNAGTTTIKAKAQASGLLDSNISSISITIQTKEDQDDPQVPDNDIEIENKTVIDNTDTNLVIESTWIITRASVENGTLIL